MQVNKKKFFEDYFNNIALISKKIEYEKVLIISNFLESIIRNNKTIYVAGNGGSAYIANHLLCDFNKGIKISSKNKLKPKVISLSNNIGTILAISNDISFHKIFSSQLENYCKKGDCLICFSSSGQSKNIIDVINFANKKGLSTILFQGFGPLNKKIKPKFYINLKYKNYGMTEDIFLSIMHSISQYLRNKFKSKNEIM